jgi:hypothetical protein
MVVYVVVAGLIYQNADGFQPRHSPPALRLPMLKGMAYKE